MSGPSQKSIESFLTSGEQIVWSLDVGGEGGGVFFHKKLQPRESYAITNQRVVVLDRTENKLVASLPLAETDLIITDRHTASGRGGMSFGGFARIRSSSGSSQRIGTLVFTTNGIRRITLPDVVDPRGVKELFMSAKRTSPSSPKDDLNGDRRARREERREKRQRIFGANTSSSPSENTSHLEKFCPNCGAQLSEDSRFCNKCGSAQP